VVHQTKTAVARTAYGKTLDTPISYSFEWDEFSGKDELIAAKQELTLEEQLKVRATEAQNNARQKALTAALDAAGIVKPNIENDPQFRLRKMFDLFKANGLSDNDARTAASNALTIDWED